MSLRFSASCWMTIAACFAPMLACAQSIPSSRISTETLRREVTRTPAGADVPVEINKVGAKVVLQTSDAAVPVANPDVISQQVKQLPVQAVVKPGPAGSVRVEDVKLQATER